MASSVATASSALLTNVLIASSAPAFARHLPFSMTPSSVLKTRLIQEEIVSELVSLLRERLGEVTVRTRSWGADRKE
jgi:hypothetical protein